MEPVLAHTGHWAVQLLYVLPLVIAILALLVKTLRDRRGQPGGGGEGRRPPAEESG